MAIDLDALRQKHEQINAPAGEKKENNDFLKQFYQIPWGTNSIRFLPWKDESQQFYAETSIHRVPTSDGKVKNVHCRKIHNEACPLCDLYYDQWAIVNRIDDKDNAESKKAKALATQIKARSRYYFNIVDREAEKGEEVKILSVGIMLFKKIVGAIMDPDFGDITDFETGHDFKIIKEKDGEWPKYDQSAPRPMSSPTGKKGEIAAYMESLHDVHALVKLEDYETCKDAVTTLLGGVVSDPKTAQQITEETKPVDVPDGDYLSTLQS